MEKWYAVQVMTGKEEKTIELCKKLTNKDILIDCFIPKCERMKRYLGEWHKEHYIMFSGYVFLITEQVEALYYELKAVPELTKILGDGTEFIPIEEKEAHLLKNIINQDYLIELSHGYVIENQVTIVSGPLKNVKGSIKSINRHKRIAELEVDILGKVVSVTVGLEIVQKTK